MTGIWGVGRIKRGFKTSIRNEKEKEREKEGERERERERERESVVRSYCLSIVWQYGRYTWSTHQDHYHSIYIFT